MTWFKVDDAFYRGPKVRKLGKHRLPAVGLWTLCGNWAADNVENNVEDGFVPWEIVLQHDPKRRYSRRLIDVGLWEEVERDGEPGVLFHDWVDYQPTREQRLSDREKWRKKKAMQRERHGQIDQVSPGDIKGDTPGDSRGESPGVSQECPEPVPSRPVPSRKEQPTHLQHEPHDSYVRETPTPPARGSRTPATLIDTHFEDFWSNYPRKEAKAAARKAWSAAARKLEPERLAKAARYWAGLWADAGTPRQFIPYPATWLNGERWNDDPPARAEATPKPSTTDARVIAVFALKERYRQNDPAHQSPPPPNGAQLAIEAAP